MGIKLGEIISNRFEVVKEDCDVFTDYKFELHLKGFGHVAEEDISKANIGKVSYMSLDHSGDPEIFDKLLEDRFPNAKERKYIVVRYGDKELNFTLREFLEKMELI